MLPLCHLFALLLPAAAFTATESFQELEPQDLDSTEAFPQVLLQTAKRSSTGHAFTHYKAKYNLKYAHGSEEHNMRERLFRTRVAEIEAHNTHPVPRSWQKGVNRFTDRMDDELLQFRGYRRHRKHGGASSEKKQPSLLSSQACATSEQTCGKGGDAGCCDGLVCGARGKCQHKKKLPKKIDWSKQLSLSTNIVDQGACGSCWAIAAQGAIELQASLLSNKSLSLSAQGMLGCTPNPHECGGTGGCDGATPELAFDWARDHGVALTQHEPYKAKTFCPESSSPAVKISGYVRIPENKAHKVLEALVMAGPLAVAADATGWHSYASGVFDDCPASPVVDHAVLLMGYGKANKAHGGKLYWKIRNSWGSDYGEDGFIRVRRHAPHGKEPCGWDYDPQKGVGCKGGPSKLWVCGECGLISDVAYPVGTSVHDSA